MQWMLGVCFQNGHIIEKICADVVYGADDTIICFCHICSKVEDGTRIYF